MSRNPPTLQAALDSLFRRHTFGMKFGLDVERALLERLGNPHHNLACIHVAGTNGKGSVCAILESVLRAAGLKTGLYTSPHLIRFNERIRVNGAPIADGALLALVERCERAAREVHAALGQEPTFFEVTTALALLHFLEAGVQVVVLETGLGGRLDATNVVIPVISVITTIGLEHTTYLGPDLASIAGEKAGIIKRGRPVVSGVGDPPARDVIRSTAAQLGARLVEAQNVVSVQVKSRDLDGQKVVVESGGGLGGTMRLPLLGEHQAENLALSVAAIDLLAEIDLVTVTPAQLRRGVESTVWPGRLQVLRRDPLVVLDGAHNPHAAERLAAAMNAIAPKTPLGLVCGFCGDKDVRGFFCAFGSRVKRAWLVPIANERNIAPDTLRQAAAGLGWEMAECSLASALDASQAWAGQVGGAVCIAGSLFLVGEVLGAQDAAGGKAT